MQSLGGHCQGLTRCKYAKKSCRYFATDTITLHFTQGPKLQRNQQRSAFAKSALHHAALESHVCNQATIKSPQQQFCQQTAEEPDENSHIEASSSQASQPVVCSQYLLAKFQDEEDGQDEVDHSTGEPEVLAVNEDAHATLITCCQREASYQASSSDPWNLESGSESSTKSHITDLLQTVPEKNDTYASKLKICIYMQNMHQDAEISISKYARICSTKYAENMHNMHK